MRVLTDHTVNPANDQLVIRAMDEPGAGGVHHCYHITGFDPFANPSYSPHVDVPGGVILFQNGPIKEAGPNGVTIEALLAIVANQLRCFQAGSFSCRENALALTKIEEAQMWLHRKTLERMRRGVEGTYWK